MLGPVHEFKMIMKNACCSFLVTEHKPFSKAGFLVFNFALDAS